MKSETKILVSLRIPESKWQLIEKYSGAEPKIRSGKISAGMHLDAFTTKAIKLFKESNSPLNPLEKSK